MELFFKECKSTLGFHQYQFRNFEAVEGWATMLVTSVLYLEWYRARQLMKRCLPEKEKCWWQHQRIYGLCQAIRLASEQSELQYIAERLKTEGGARKLKRLVRNGFAREYQAAA